MATNNAVNNILYGTTGGGNAAAGDIGEFISSQIVDASSFGITSGAMFRSWIFPHATA